MLVFIKQFILSNNLSTELTKFLMQQAFVRKVLFVRVYDTASVRFDTFLTHL